ncbi:hypothetical protein E2I00_011128 [Balaenoptera physalus]|uniref:Small monomeric GTPase n=1 Tax=Balaenoptera physalus TaxID=9770 RepID=A0A6A1Q6D1_BALPH|nr:hypothetical protein E2I00_011128 [Balaenoptera physalus]
MEKPCTNEQPLKISNSNVKSYTILIIQYVLMFSSYQMSLHLSANEILEGFSLVLDGNFCFVLNSKYEKVPVILVGNKVDLESEREVSSNEGRALAEEWACPFMETSAKSKTMVDELFAEIVRQMNYAAQPDKGDPCCSACNIQ